MLQLPVGWMDRPTNSARESKPTSHTIEAREPDAAYRTAHYRAVSARHQALIDEVVELLLHQSPEHVQLIRELVALLPRP